MRDLTAMVIRDRYPIVSIIMSTYNVEKYVSEAVESILNQTFVNFEFIIVDDKSIDNTYKILKKFSQNDPRIRLLRNDINCGITSSLNKALRHAEGYYIARMDGDDVSALDRIEKQLDYLSNNNNLSLIGGHICYIDDAGDIIENNTKLLNQTLIYEVLPYAQPIPHVTWFAKKELFDRLGGYHAKTPAQDYDFILRMKSSGMEFTNIDILAVYVRMGRDGNVASTAELKRRKAVNYMYKRYIEREQTGKDRHTDAYLEKYISSSTVMINLHDLSQKVFNYGVQKYKNKQIILGAVLAIISSLISPYQMQYLFRLLRYKILIKYHI